MVASQIVMVRPARFGYNAETAENNRFQTAPAEESGAVQAAALAEFDHFVQVLQEKDIAVLVMDDRPFPVKPDAVFPNNWFCTLPGGTFCLFPMYAANRRAERSPEIIESIERRFDIRQKIDLSAYEQDHWFLEGTGSMVFDFPHKIIYACYSPRTEEKLLRVFAEQLGYKVMLFHAADESGTEIYHTNVMLHIGEGYAVICLEAFSDEKEAALVRQSLLETHHELVVISREQMHHFAGNMLQVANTKGEKFTVLSRQALEALLPEQKVQMAKYTRLLPVPLFSIERAGGGSARCMMAEIYLDKKKE